MEHGYPTSPIYQSDQEMTELVQRNLTDKARYFHFDLPTPEQRAVEAIRTRHILRCPPWKQLRQAPSGPKAPKVLYDVLTKYVSVRDKARIPSRHPLLRTATIPVVREFDEVAKLDLIDLRRRRRVS